jgi:hypothetical protein
MNIPLENDVTKEPLEPVGYFYHGYDYGSDRVSRFFSIKGFSAGSFIAIDQDDRVGAGITLSYIPFGVTLSF